MAMLSDTIPFQNRLGVASICGVLLAANLIAAERPQKSADSVGNTNTMKLFLVKGDYDAADVAKMKLHDIPLEPTPLFTSDDIVHYELLTHVFVLADAAHDKIRQLKVPISGRPFVVVVENRRVYSGNFWSKIASVTFDGVIINEPLSNDRKLAVRFNPMRGDVETVDPRNDPELRAILKSRRSARYRMTYSVTDPDFSMTWVDYDDLREWVKPDFSTLKVLHHHKGKREMAVLLFPWELGVQTKQFTIFHKTRNGWKVLLNHTVALSEDLVVESKPDALDIKAKSGKPILILPD